MGRRGAEKWSNASPRQEHPEVADHVVGLLRQVEDVVTESIVVDAGLDNRALLDRPK